MPMCGRKLLDALLSLALESRAPDARRVLLHRRNLIIGEQADLLTAGNAKVTSPGPAFTAGARLPHRTLT